MQVSSPSKLAGRLSFGDELSLDSVRETLIRQEETIIFCLIERSQWKRNLPAYEPDHPSFPFPNMAGKSFLDYFLFETESVHAKVRRYTSPDEHPFNDNLPEPILPSLDFPSHICPFPINVNDRIMKKYLDSILPQICEDGDDHNYGSSVTNDIAVLQALSKRIHFGMFVAEAKFRKNRDSYTSLAKNNDTDGLMEQLTNAAVEERLLERVRLKTATYGQDIEVNAEPREKTKHKISPSLVADLFRDFVIPLTKDVQVQYLLQRPFISS